MVPYPRMTYRLNTDRLVFFSVLLWALLPPGVFAWEEIMLLSQGQ